MTTVLHNMMSLQGRLFVTSPASAGIPQKRRWPPPQPPLSTPMAGPVEIMLLVLLLEMELELDLEIQLEKWLEKQQVLQHR